MRVAEPCSASQTVSLETLASLIDIRGCNSDCPLTGILTLFGHLRVSATDSHDDGHTRVICHIRAPQTVGPSFLSGYCRWTFTMPGKGN
jgi:hypothetical protein